MNSNKLQTNPEKDPKSPKSRSRKRVQVDFTFRWEFDSKDWNENKAYRREVEKEIRIVAGYDSINAFFALNDIVHPELNSYSVKILE